METIEESPASILGKRPLSPGPVPEPYTPSRDTTLTLTQSEAGGFRPQALYNPGIDFRADSTPTLSGFSTGYHEAAVTTDTFNILSSATDNRNGTHTLVVEKDNAFFKKYNGHEVNSTSRDIVMSLADVYRTFTSQTIMSAPRGKAAGHPGSNIKETGKNKAHDLIRKSTMDILRLDPKTTLGMTRKSVATLFAAITVTSMAPGEVARTVKGGTSGLKDFRAKPVWEENRNEGKKRTEALFQDLTPSEQHFVTYYSTAFMNSTQEGVTTFKRNIPSLRATSPEREVRIVSVTNEVQGGAYIDGERSVSPGRSRPSIAPPTTISEQGLYATQSFRTYRRK
jgi:hypothetical protein